MSRTIIPLNQGWLFAKERDLPIFDSIPPFQGTPIDLPHTWNAQDGSDGAPGGIPDYDRTRAWYQKKLSIDPALSGKKLILNFGAAGTACELYVNGLHVPFATYDLYGLGHPIEYRHRGGFSGFRFDVTEFIHCGEENHIAVLVDNTKMPEIAPLNGDFNCQGGLYRSVHLIAANPVHFDLNDDGTDGVFITAQKADDLSADFHVEARAVIVNDSVETRTVTVRFSLEEPSRFDVPDHPYIKRYLRFAPESMYTPGGSTVKEFPAMDITLAPGERREYSQEIYVSSPRLWQGLDDPYQYTVKGWITENDTALDTWETSIGFRSYQMPTPQVTETGEITGGGFYLNGKKYLLHGACKHQDWGRGENALGYAIGEKEMLSDAANIYESGFSFLRLAHYQHSNEEIDLYDRLGICVWSEVGVVDEIISPSDPNYEAFMTVTQAQLMELIKQQYHHPSILVWGLGNELRREMTGDFQRTAGDDPDSPDLATDYHQRMNALAHDLDPTRKTTYAAFCLFHRTHDWESDSASMNLYPYWYVNGMEKWYMNKSSMEGIMSADFHALKAMQTMKPLGISEYGCGGEVGFLRPMEADGTVTAGTDYPDWQWSTTFQAYLHEIIYDEIVHKLPWIWSSALWQMFDSASDKKQGGLPGTNDKGLISFDHQTKKDAFYFYKANWNRFEPFIHIVAAENMDVVRAYSNYRLLQLYVDDVPFGEPISDSHPNSPVPSGMGIFLWTNVKKRKIRIQGRM